MTNNYPLREIIARRYYRMPNAKIGTGSVELTLNCGHGEFRSRNKEPHVRARCWACHIDGLDTDDRAQPEREQSDE